MKKTIIVIGANSALADEVIPVLSKDNTVITAGRKNCDIYCDITKKVELPAGTDIIINFAAAFGGESDKDIKLAYETNCIGILNICMAAKDVKAERLISISSLSAEHNTKSSYYSIYAITKRQEDELAEFYCNLNKIPLTILRPSQIYGENRRFAAHQPFFYHIINKAHKGQDIEIYGKNDALRNYIHAHDLAVMIKKVITKQVNGTYSCLYPTDVTFSQISKVAQQVFNRGGQVIFLKDKPDIPDNIFKKDLTLYKKLGYYPKVSLEEGLERIKKHREAREL
jgi:nucleoside-diphosphate-sugar epimerase